MYFSNCFLAWQSLLSVPQLSAWDLGGFLKFFPDKAISTREWCGFLNKEDPTQPRSRFADIAFAPSFQNEKLSRNETRLDGAGALRLAKALRNATQHTGTLFGHDVRTAYQLLARVLQHESHQQGFELAATRDADFHEVGGCGQDGP